MLSAGRLSPFGTMLKSTSYETARNDLLKKGNAHATFRVPFPLNLVGDVPPSSLEVHGLHLAPRKSIGVDLSTL